MTCRSSTSPRDPSAPCSFPSVSSFFRVTSTSRRFGSVCLCVALHARLTRRQDCLSVIFTVVVDELDVKLERVIGNLLSLVKLRPNQAPSCMTFTLGAGDEHTIKTRDEKQSVPVTGTCIQRLFEDLGIHAVVTLFSAVMSEHKILFHSKSYARLQNACHALTSLMYPFRFTHTYIPLLPSYLFEVLNAPTPFVIGVHSSLKSEVADILDVIIVDLDGGYIAVPDCVHVPSLDDASSADLLSSLCSVIRPQLACADDAFPTQQPSASPPETLDKEIRAIFIRFFALLLSGYRTCLQTVRIHPKPFITFHKVPPLVPLLSSLVLSSDPRRPFAGSLPGSPQPH